MEVEGVILKDHGNVTIVVIGGDLVFVVLFLIYFQRLKHHGHGLI